MSTTTKKEEGRSFLCFNCNPRLPKFKSFWTKLLTFTTIIVLLLSILQIAALSIYSEAFYNSKSEACCGLIEQYSHSQDGAICHERNIIDGRIEKQIFDGSTLCIINDQECEYYFDEKLGNVTTLEDCLETGGYPLTDICGEQPLKDYLQPMELTYICIALSIAFGILSFISFCELIGCFDDSCCCSNGYVSLSVNGLQFIIWAILVVVSTIMIENVGQSGYASYRPEDSLAEEFMEDNCALDNEQIIWVDYSVVIPSWMQTSVYQIVTIVGAVLSVVEFFLCFVVYYFDDGNGNKIVDTKAAIQLSDTVPLGNVVKDDDGNEANVANTNGDVVRLESAEDDGGDTGYRDSDDDVLFDDEEKEMEFVTPGGPTPQ